MFCIFLTVFPARPLRDLCIWCRQLIVARQKLWRCLQAAGVSPTSSFPAASFPTTGLSNSGFASPPSQTSDPQFSSRCQQLLQRRSWSPWGDVHVDVHRGPWRTGQPHPVWAQTTGGSTYVHSSILNNLNEILILNENIFFLCSYMQTLPQR